jgi:hypothetical protein
MQNLFLVNLYNKSTEIKKIAHNIVFIVDFDSLVATSADSQ